jgi:hypothetical protein
MRMSARVTTRRWLLRDSRLTFVLLVWTAFAASVLLYFSDWPAIKRDMPMRPQAASKQTTQAGQGDPDGIYTGAIRMPTRGRFCRETAFDNRTGRMIDRGLVDCRQAGIHAAAQNPQVGIEYARLRSIGKAFNHQ